MHAHQKSLVKMEDGRWPTGPSGLDEVSGVRIPRRVEIMEDKKKREREIERER